VQKTSNEDVTENAQ